MFIAGKHSCLEQRNTGKNSYNVAVLLDSLDSLVNCYDYHQLPTINSPEGG